MSKKPDLSNYVEVSERISHFREKYPNGSLQSEIVDSPVDGFVAVKAYAFRTPDDPAPGVGLAWEPVPGKTPYTKDSELMNAETSAWGRAIIAVGASDASRVASANEVRNRQESQPQREAEWTQERLQTRLKFKAAELAGDDLELAKEFYASYSPEVWTFENVKVAEKAMETGVAK